MGSEQQRLKEGSKSVEDNMGKDANLKGAFRHVTGREAG
jgi:hypothetical protein